MPIGIGGNISNNSQLSEQSNITMQVPDIYLDGQKLSRSMTPYITKNVKMRVVVIYDKMVCSLGYWWCKTLQDFKIIEGTIKDSIRETTYSYFTIDFNSNTSDKIPLQFSKIQIISINDALEETLEFVGHLDSIKYPDFSTTEKPLHLELSVMNLRGILTKKSNNRKDR